MHWELEERSLNAWPALQCLLHDGWMLRFSAGYSRRANSVQALFPGSVPVAEKIAWCEQQYRAQQLPTVFKITPFSQPGALDELLEERAYQREAETDVLYAPLDAWPVAPNDQADTVILPREQWLDVYAQVTGQSPAARIRHQAIMQAIVPALCPVAVMEQGSPVAVGLGVLERGMVGVYDLATDARYRRQGCATRIFAALFSWAVAHGARGAYLNVMSENLPAQALYAKLGFAPCYKYWYRVKPTIAETPHGGEA